MADGHRAARDQRASSGRAVIVMVAGAVFFLAPALPFDRAAGRTSNEFATLVWPNPLFLLGLGIAVLVPAAVAWRTANSAVRQFAMGLVVVPGTAAATIHLTQLVRLHYGAGLRLPAMGAGGWLLAAASAVFVAAVLGSRSLLATGQGAGAGTADIDRARPPVLAAVVCCGAVLLEWLVGPLAVTGGGFIPYGSHARVTDVYGGLAYIDAGAIPPQAIAGLGLVIVLTVTVLACGTPGPGAAGTVAGAALAAAVDTGARLAELAHPGAHVSVRPMPLLATAVTAVALGAVAARRAAASRRGEAPAPLNVAWVESSREP